MLGVSRHLIGFRWSRSVKKLLVLSAMMVALSFGLTFIALGWIANAGGGVLTLAGSIISLRGLAKRLDRNHRMVQKIPSWLLGLNWLLPKILEKQKTKK
jgi:hypothetical protein